MTCLIWDYQYPQIAFFKYQQQWAIEKHEQEGAVVPTNLRKGVFSTAAADNVDVNSKSSTAFSSLHGTAASINQHLNNDNIESEIEIARPLVMCKTLKSLPPSYTEMTPCYLPSQVEMPESAEPPNLEMSKELQDIISEDKIMVAGARFNIMGSISFSQKSTNQNPCRYFVDVTNMAR